MKNLIEKLHDFFYVHYKGTIIAVMCCLMVISTAVCVSVKPVMTVINCQSIINEVGEDKITAAQKSDQSATGATKSTDLFDDNTKETTYKDTEEYKDKKNEIDWMNSRMQELGNHLMTTLTREVSDFTDAYTQYSLVQNPANQESLSKYTTDDFYSQLCDRSTKKDNYVPYNCWFADFDKSTVRAYCETREGLSYIVALTESTNTGWRVSGFDIINQD